MWDITLTGSHWNLCVCVFVPKDKREHLVSCFATLTISTLWQVISVKLRLDDNRQAPESFALHSTGNRIQDTRLMKEATSFFHCESPAQCKSFCFWELCTHTQCAHMSQIRNLHLKICILNTNITLLLVYKNIVSSNDIKSRGDKYMHCPECLKLRNALFLFMHTSYYSLRHKICWG